MYTTVGKKFTYAVQCSGGAPPYKWTATGVPGPATATGKFDNWYEIGSGSYNIIDYPLVTYPTGTADFEWKIQFLTPTRFSLYGVSATGIISRSDAGGISEDFSPVPEGSPNGDPYFTLKRDGWIQSRSWVAGDYITFNTYKNAQKMITVEESGIVWGTPLKEYIGSHSIEYKVTDSEGSTANLTLKLHIV
jgi:hypothetical protein